MPPSSPARSLPAQPYAAPALEKGLDILELLAEERDGLTQAQVAERLDRTPAEIFRMLVCLHRRGYVDRRPPGEAYTLSAKLFELSHRHPPTRSLLDAALPILRDLAGRTRQSCHLGVRYDDQLLVVASVDSPEPRSLVVRVGSRFAMGSTASGRVLLAWGGGEGSTGGDDEMQAIRRRGFEQHRSDVLRGVIDLSYPVFDGRGEVVAALTIPYLSTRRRPRGVAAARDLLAAAAARLSAQLGHQTGGTA